MVKNIFKNSQKLLERQHNSILSAAGIITIAVFASSILGFARTRLLVSYFYDQNISNLAPGAALDAYLVSFRIPDLVFQLLVIGALSAAFIPVFSGYHQKDQKQAFNLANSMINLILLVFVLFSIIIFIFAKSLNFHLTGTNFSQQQLQLATNFTRIMLFSQLFFAISSFMTGIIQASHRFLIPALAPLAYNLGIILGIIILGPTLGLYGAAIGVVFGAFLHLALQIPLAIKLGYYYRPIIQIKHPGVKQMGQLMLPRTLALSVDQIELLAITFLATTLPTGSYVIITLAQQLMKAPVRIFGVPIGQASLPFLSKESSQNNLEVFKKTFLNSFHQILYLALPATAVLIVLRIPLVRILFGAKDFPWAATILTGKMVAILSLAIFAYASTQLLTRAFYALQNTKTPFISAIISLAAGIGLSVILVLKTDLGVLGIAWGSAIGAITQATYLFFTLSKRLGGFNLGQLYAPIIKMTIAAVLTGIFLWVPMRLLDEILDTTRTLNLIMLTIAATGIGGLVYLWLSKLLNIKELDSYLKLFDKLGNWKKVLYSTEETLEHSDTTL